MTVRVTTAGGVTTLVLDRADKKNALTDAMYGTLADALVAAEHDPAQRVILIRGEGEGFCAGNDVGEFAQIAAGQGPGERNVHRYLEALAHATRPIVAAVQGHAVGIGTTMLLHCDQVVLAEDAQLSTPFVGLALVPEAAASVLLPARIGHVRAYGMFALGERVKAADALAWGLANKVVPVASLQAEAEALAARLTKQPLGALVATKRLMRSGDALGRQMAAENADFARQLQSDEAREAFQAFAEKRPPDFSRLERG